MEQVDVKLYRVHCLLTVPSHGIPRFLFTRGVSTKQSIPYIVMIVFISDRDLGRACSLSSLCWTSDTFLAQSKNIWLLLPGDFKVALSISCTGANTPSTALDGSD